MRLFFLIIPRRGVSGVVFELVRIGVEGAEDAGESAGEDVDGLPFPLLLCLIGRIDARVRPYGSFPVPVTIGTATGGGPRLSNG